MSLDLPFDEWQRVIDSGRAAQELLDSEGFQRVVDDLTSLHLAGLVASKPGVSGQEAREYHHLMQYALTELVQELSMRAAAGQSLEQHIKDIEEQAE
jgi:hypothetical protein